MKTKANVKLTGIALSVAALFSLAASASQAGVLASPLGSVSKSDGVIVAGGSPAPGETVGNAASGAVGTVTGALGGVGDPTGGLGGVVGTVTGALGGIGGGNPTGGLGGVVGTVANTATGAVGTLTGALG
ncbi:TPA: hypothetical protein QDE52_37225, partial [Burkholderia cenocepacia]|nr:hypothetical protein [Burkholderia cenocepacia]